MRIKQSLNGIWQRRIGKGEFKTQNVPYSSLCVGESCCIRSFNKESELPRAFLVFEAITYKAVVTVNSKTFEPMLPYIPYRLEISDVIKPTDNQIKVDIVDVGLPFGSSAGWENYGGIIRDVYIEYTSSDILTDVTFFPQISDDLQTALCKVEYKYDANENCKIKTSLKDVYGNVIASSLSKESDEMCVVNPKLWSPENPYLYLLESELLIDNTVVDFRQQKVGIKEFCAKGKRFYLNKKEYFLLGVNRHDIFGDSGHTLSEEQMQKDMRLIKETGCNFVRLVHYPHNKRIIEIADEIGLLVSEEPGLWWADMKNEKTVEGALEVLKGVINRDKNNVSVAFWLSFNECYFTLDFLQRSALVARENDPYRMVSGANCMSIEMTKENYLKCGFDFYTMHPYAENPSRMRESAEKLSEMPLLFSEWGGFPCDNNERTFNSFIDTVIELKNNPDDKPCIAGAVFWEWAETYDFNRGRPACIEGVLNEGLVDMYRNPTKNLAVFKDGFAKINQSECTKGKIKLLEPQSSFENTVPVTMQEPSAEEAWDDMITKSKQPIKDYCLRSIREIKVGPVLPEKVNRIGNINTDLILKPYVLTNKELCIDINRKVSKLLVFGNVSMPKGYPIHIEYGEKVAEYTVEYTDGSYQVHTLLNGEDITTATMLHGSSRINPTAASAERVIEFSYDGNFEQYIVNLFKIKTDQNKTVKALKLKALDNSYSPLIYGISAEN